MTAKTKTSRLLFAVLILLLAGCAAKPTPACEFAAKHELWFRQILDTATAGLSHPNSPAALGDSIVTLRAIEAEVKAPVAEDGRQLQNDTILAIGKIVANLQWLQADGESAALSPAFSDDADDLIQAMKDLGVEAAGLRARCEVRP